LVTPLLTAFPLAVGERTVTEDSCSERALLVRAVGNDRNALRTIYHSYAPSIRRFLHGVLGDLAAADDGTQETFARAFRGIAAMREADRIAPWLFGIARNVSLEQRRTRRRDGPRPTCDDRPPREEERTERTPEDALLGEETARVLLVALGRLSEDRRAALLLRVDHGLAYEDIAGLLGWSLAKVKVEIHRARLVLREHLDVYEGAGR